MDMGGSGGVKITINLGGETLGNAKLIEADTSDAA
jgi:hypothetical protein